MRELGLPGFASLDAAGGGSGGAAVGFTSWMAFSASRAALAAEGGITNARIAIAKLCAVILLPSAGPSGCSVFGPEREIWRFEGSSPNCTKATEQRIMPVSMAAREQNSLCYPGKGVKGR